MTDRTPAAHARANVDELRAVMSTLDDAALDALVSAILRAGRVYVLGLGRSGLMAKAIGMRLMHIGLNVFAVGEIATPGIGAGDLLITFSARGGSSILASARKARSLDADVAAISVAPDEELRQLAQVLVVLPIRSEVPTEQHAGSLFEQSCLVLGDAVCRAVQERLGVETESLDLRHANLP